MATLRPTSQEDLTALVAQAAASGQPLRLQGNGTKQGLGAPLPAHSLLDLSAFCGVEAYEPEELTFTAWAGTPLSDVTAMLAERRQMLAFEPPDFTAVLAAFGAQQAVAMPGTVGGMVAVGMAGPRQILRWSVRDHVLGFTAVNGRGELFKAGGRVVKNVTGYDLPKLLCGSFGTLAVLTRLTLRVLPVPERAMTLACAGLDARRAVAVCAQALRTPAEVSGACWLPAQLARQAPGALATDAPLTCLRLEGFRKSLPDRAMLLRDALREHGDWQLVEGDEVEALWRATRDVAWLVNNASGRWLWRIVLAPARGGALAQAITARHPEAELFLDRAGGLLWLSLPLPEPGVAVKTAAHLRALFAEHGGRAMLFAAPEAYRAAVPVFPPLPRALTALSERLRAQFDPAGILNPGIMDNLPADAQTGGD